VLRPGGELEAFNIGSRLTVGRDQTPHLSPKARIGASTIPPLRIFFFVWAAMLRMLALGLTALICWVSGTLMVIQDDQRH
jgi:hypothetical protein